MKKIIGAIILCLFAALRASGQSTILSGTVADASSQQWANGTFQLTFQPNPTIPQGPYTWTGGTLPTSISGVLNSVGAYSVSVPSNTAISPIGTGWNLQVCPQATSPCFAVNNLTVAGPTQTFNVTPPAISISLINPTAAPMLAYSDAEITSADVGSYYFQIPILNYRFCQAVTGQTCTLWNSFGAGPPPTGNPRLDQVLNQNQAKTFNQGGAALGFTAGPGLNLSGETSPLTVPVIVSCTTAAPGQICDDGTNYHIFVNGVDTLLVFSSASIGSGNNGDVVGYKVLAGQVSLQDLGPVDTATGNSFININMTSPLDGDLSCWNAGGPPFWVNCTPGAADTTINGATNSYTISFADQLTTIDHDIAGSVSATITLPTATTLGINPGFVFSYSNHSTHNDTIAPTTWTINSAATLTVFANTICNKIRVDPNSATNWLTECANIAASGGGPASATLTGTNSSGQLIVSGYKFSISITDLSPVVGDDGLILVIDPAIPVHLTRFACGVQGTTSVISNLVKSSTSLLADQTCTAGSVETVTTSSFVNGSGQCGGTTSCAIPAHAPVTLHIGTITGTPTAIQLSIEGTID